MVSSGVLAFGGGHRSRRYRRLWTRQGKQRLLAFFAKGPGYPFNEAGQLQGCTMPRSKFLQAVDFGFNSVVPGDLQVPPERVLQA